MAELTETEISEIFMGSVSAQIVASALNAFQTAAPENRARLLERATDALIEVANAIGCTVRKSPAHLVMMQKTETMIAKRMDEHGKNIVARAAEAGELRRKLERAEAENLQLLAQLAGKGETLRLAAVA